MARTRNYQPSKAHVGMALTNSADLIKQLEKNGKETEKRRHQIHEYWQFWADTVPRSLKRSFGTLGYGSLREAVDELADRENKRAKK